MTDHDPIFKLIHDEVRKLKPEAPEITPQTDLTQELGLDSVQVLEMCMQLEDHLDLSIPINRLGGVRTAGQLAATLAALHAEAAAD